MARINVTDPARRDIDSLLAHSLAAFGTMAQRRYAAPIRAALKDLAADPLRIGSKGLAGSREGIRTDHLQNSRFRVAEFSVRNPRHVVVYRLAGQDMEDVLRLLHDAMDPDRHLP